MSLPLAVYGGVCADDSESYFGLLEAGSTLARRLGVKYLEMRNRAEPWSFPQSMPRRELYFTFTQDLSSGPDKLLAAFPRDTRYAVRKSLKAGLTWEEHTDVDDFYEIYARSVHRLGTPVFSRALFHTLLAAFQKRCRMFGVRKNGRTIAGVFCFYFNGTVLPYYGGALSEYYEHSPNNFMYWKLMEQSSLEGYRTFDFGRSKHCTGAFSFKSSWGMKATSLPYRYGLVQAKELPRLSPVDQKFRWPIAIWKRMPFALSKIVGPKVVQWIPSV